MSRLRLLAFGTLELGEEFDRKGDRTRALCERESAWLEGAIRRFQVEAIACEAFQYYRPTKKQDWRTTEGIAVGRLIGEFSAVARRAGIPFVEYQNNSVKATVAMSGKATKQDLARYVSGLLGVRGPIEPVHASDALAVAICYASKAPLERAMQKARSA